MYKTRSDPRERLPLLRIRQDCPCELNVLHSDAEIPSLGFCNLFPMGHVAIDQCPRLLFGVLLHPAHILGFGPAVQRMWQRDGRAHEDVVQDDERWEPRSKLRRSERRVIEEQQLSVRTSASRMP